MIQTTQFVSMSDSVQKTHYRTYSDEVTERIARKILAGIDPEPYGGADLFVYRNGDNVMSFVMDRDGIITRESEEVRSANL